MSVVKSGPSTSFAGPPPLQMQERMKGVRFAGYAAVFDRPDGGGDIIRKGAFLESLKRAGEVPLLWQHKAGRVLGRIEHLSEDKRGLRVIARLDGGAEGRRVGALLQSGKLDGLSFGYRVREARPGARRELIDLDLVEVSLVAKPMQRLARVHAVQDQSSVRATNSMVIAETVAK